ncbi:hypothetical protein Vi05172_g11885 [Venturia inaequalis]|nr:hypothetical protein Vi05172_g11885 [Venturia inaequalis]
MLFQTVFTSLALSATLVAGHAQFQELWVNGKDQAKSCVRMPKSNSPVQNVSSTDMRCNVGGSVGMGGLCEIPAGANVTVEMHQHDDRKCSNEAVGGRHFGPVMIYMCSVPDAKTATGDCSWVKIAEDTYAGTDASWGTEKLNWGCGKQSFIVPAALKEGNYLIRAEAIALHAAGRKDGAQFYMSCYQVNVSGKGTEVLPKGVSFPGAYKNTDPGILIDIYQNQGSYGKQRYIAPGPKVWTPASSTKDVPGEAAPTKPEPAQETPKSEKPKEAKPPQTPDVPETKPDPVPEPEPTKPEPAQETPKSEKPKEAKPPQTPDVPETKPDQVPESEPEPTKPEPAQQTPKPEKPKEAKPTQTPDVPETKPDPVPEPEPTKPEPAQQTPKPEKPKEAKPPQTPDVPETKPDPVPEVAAPEVVAPEVAAPEVAAPEVVVPAPVQPKPVQPKPAPKSPQPPPKSGNVPKPRPGKDDKQPCFGWFCNNLPKNDKPPCHGWFCNLIPPSTTTNRDKDGPSPAQGWW